MVESWQRHDKSLKMHVICDPDFVWDKNLKVNPFARTTILWKECRTLTLMIMKLNNNDSGFKANILIVKLIVIMKLVMIMKMKRFIERLRHKRSKERVVKPNVSYNNLWRTKVAREKRTGSSTTGSDKKKAAHETSTGILAVQVRNKDALVSGQDANSSDSEVEVKGKVMPATKKKTITLKQLPKLYPEEELPSETIGTCVYILIQLQDPKHEVVGV